MEKLEEIAKVCHEANKAFSETNGDYSHLSWEDATEETRAFAIKSVGYVLAGNTSPSLQHEQWMKEKINEGWVYGNERNKEKKTHPSIVAYENLPEFEKKKDKLFIAVVTALK